MEAPARLVTTSYRIVVRGTVHSPNGAPRGRGVKPICPNPIDAHAQQILVRHPMQSSAPQSSRFAPNLPHNRHYPDN